MKANQRSYFLALSLLVGSFAFEAFAAAQGADPAEVLFNRGLAAMEKGRYPAGCPDLAESQRLEPLPGTLFTLATCEDRWGHSATAVTLYSEYLQIFEQLPQDQRAVQGERPKLAKAQREKLAADVPQLTLTLPPGAPAGVVVKQDGRVVAAAALGAALQVDPGDHTVSTEAPGGGVWQQRITLGKGEKKGVALGVRAAAAAAPAPVITEAPVVPPVVATGPGGRRAAAYVIGSVGVAALAFGGVMGGLTLGKKGIANQHCGAAIKSSDENGCDRAGLDAVSSGKTFGLMSTVGLAAGLAGFGAAVILHLTESTPPKPTARSRDRWISAAILSVDPTGAAVGARGAW